MTTVRVAAVQETPVFLDRDATVDKVCDLIATAAAGGAQLVVFPEAFVPGYPDWVWRTRPWADGPAAWYERLFANSVTVPGSSVAQVAAAARSAGVHVAVGMTERDPAGGTLFNTLLFLGPDGSVLSRHRKLMATGGERLVWGSGDGSGLVVHDTEIGRLGGLICWENYMPLARTALYEQGVQLYVAPTWDNSDEWVPTLRHIAKEGGCHVIGVTPFLRGSDVPSDIPGRDELYGGDEDWMSRGNTTIVSAGGSIVAGPLIGEAGIVTAELDLDATVRHKRMFDCTGHYARPDVLGLVVDRRAKPSLAKVGDDRGDDAPAD